jgi:hypothetical protein
MYKLTGLNFPAMIFKPISYSRILLCQGLIAYIVRFVMVDAA